MFSKNDKITCTLISYNKNYEPLDFILNLKEDIKNIEFNKDIHHVTLTTYHEGTTIFNENTINIYIGKKDTFESIMNISKNLRKKLILPIHEDISKIKLDTSILLYEIEENSVSIYKELTIDDYIVNSLEELKETVTEISKHFKEIQNRITLIKKYKIKGEN